MLRFEWRVAAGSRFRRVWPVRRDLFSLSCEEWFSRKAQRQASASGYPIGRHRRADVQCRLGKEPEGQNAEDDAVEEPIVPEVFRARSVANSVVGVFIHQLQLSGFRALHSGAVLPHSAAEQIARRPTSAKPRR
jgi:hypothetical protein